MAENTVRYGLRNPTDPVLHDLPPFKYEGQLVPIQLEIRRCDDGIWRGRLIFGGSEEGSRPTAEIFCAKTEADLWECVNDLRDHHVRDLYRSVTE
jgi:hypothetical protein